MKFGGVTFLGTQGENAEKGKKRKRVDSEKYSRKKKAQGNSFCLVA